MTHATGRGRRWTAAALGAARIALGGALVAAGLSLGVAAHGEELYFETPTAVPELAWGPELSSRVVEIRNADLAPTRIELAPGQKVAWRNSASTQVRVSFDAAVARSMICTDLVNFAVEEGRLRSEALRAGDVATLCQLAPGQYRYRVERQGQAKPAEGEIVVHAAAVGARQ